MKGSRFVACVHPVTDRDAARLALRSLREEFTDASHHCSAWRLDPAGRETHTDDDGEPANSAGAPILRMIEGRELAGILVVVMRWFGGTKLGVGGLIRAYGGAAGEALDAAEVVERPILVRLQLTFPYEASSVVDRCCARHGACEVSSVFDAQVRRTVDVALEVREEFEHDLREGSSGRVVTGAPPLE